MVSLILEKKREKMKVVKESFVLTLVIPVILTWSLPLPSFLSLFHATSSYTSLENNISHVLATGLLYRYCIEELLLVLGLPLPYLLHVDILYPVEPYYQYYRILPHVLVLLALSLFLVTNLSGSWRHLSYRDR